MDKLPKDPIGKVIAEHTHYSHDQEDILDIHIGNPLKRISVLLEEIKKQKAFSFTLKGSLGIAGVFLALSVFGIFGGGKILCDKGRQSEIGTLKVLNIKETQDETEIPVISFILSYFSPHHTYNRMVLVKADESTIEIPYSRNVDLTTYANYKVIATGNLDSCSNTLNVDEGKGVETIQ